MCPERRQLNNCLPASAVDDLGFDRIQQRLALLLLPAVAAADGLSHETYNKHSHIFFSDLIYFNGVLLAVCLTQLGRVIATALYLICTAKVLCTQTISKTANSWETKTKVVFFLVFFCRKAFGSSCDTVYVLLRVCSLHEI